MEKSQISGIILMTLAVATLDAWAVVARYYDGSAVLLAAVQLIVGVVLVKYTR
jgi:hypothetical protein